MITRYSRPEMRAIWTDENKLKIWLQIALLGSEALVQATGVEESKALYLWLAPGQHPNYPEGVQDDTHFSPEGARRIAEDFAVALRATDLPLAKRLRPVQ